MFVVNIFTIITENYQYKYNKIGIVVITIQFVSRTCFHVIKFLCPPQTLVISSGHRLSGDWYIPNLPAHTNDDAIKSCAAVWECFMDQPCDNKPLISKSKSFWPMSSGLHRRLTIIMSS